MPVCVCLQIDWDYHMRLAPAGTPGTAGAGSVINFYHFRHWRQTGVAYEVRHCTYNAPNWTLLSTARGRTKEYKDRCALHRESPAYGAGQTALTICMPRIGAFRARTALQGLRSDRWCTANNVQGHMFAGAAKTLVGWWRRVGSGATSCAALTTALARYVRTRRTTRRQTRSSSTRRSTYLSATCSPCCTSSAQGRRRLQARAKHRGGHVLHVAPQMPK
jgi:Domain of unknown function (DUF4471)